MEGSWNNPPPLPSLPPQQPMSPPPMQQPPPPPQKQSGGLFTGLSLGCLLGCGTMLLILLVCAGVFIFGIFALFESEESENFFDSPTLAKSNVKQTVIQEGDKNETIAVIAVNGMITRQDNYTVASSRRICKALRNAAGDAKVKAILIDMDTPGGEVTAADEIHREIRKIKAERPKLPILTCMHSMGASGGYYVAAATDYIIANQHTFTGSIGVIMSTFNATELMQKIGLQEVTFCSGNMKDMLSMSRPISEKEKEYCNALIQESFTAFAQVVADGRKEYPDVDAVKAAEFADGRVLSGAHAKELGLVDELGGFDDAIGYATQQASLANPRVVLYSEKGNWMDMLLDTKSNLRPLGVQDALPVKGVQLEAGKMYYLAPTVIAK
ncbi:MAG: signal peptide peptidase SppA [Victivallales bacterium]|nr:signal peptide peptidase SppA [Victivallales bacterium]